MKENVSLSAVMKKVVWGMLGLLQGAVGNYLGFLGLAFAFPQTEPHAKDYEEDLFLVPFGYILMLIWIAVTIAAFICLRKNKANLLSFVIPWIIGLVICLMAIKLW